MITVVKRIEKFARQHILDTNERGTLALLRRLIERLEDRLFARDDEWATRRGLQISRRVNGHGRRYRDPRWDLVAACESCAGSGAAGARGCLECDGRGTVRLDRLPGRAGMAS